MKVKGKKDSTFDKDEEIWIIKQYHQGYSSTQVRRIFLKTTYFDRFMKNLSLFWSKLQL